MGKDAVLNDSGCCVLNLCNGIIGQKGSCVTDCAGRNIVMEWEVDWDETHENV